MSPTVKYDVAIGLAIYVSLLIENSNIWGKSLPFRDIRLRNMSDLEFDLSRLLKAKCQGVIGLSEHDFLLMSNSNTGRNYIPLRDIRL